MHKHTWGACIKSPLHNVGVLCAFLCSSCASCPGLCSSQPPYWSAEFHQNCVCASLGLSQDSCVSAAAGEERGLSLPSFGRRHLLDGRNACKWQHWDAIWDLTHFQKGKRKFQFDNVEVIPDASNLRDLLRFERSISWWGILVFQPLFLPWKRCIVYFDLQDNKQHIIINK